MPGTGEPGRGRTQAPPLAETTVCMYACMQPGREHMHACVVAQPTAYACIAARPTAYLCMHRSPADCVLMHASQPGLEHMHAYVLPSQEHMHACVAARLTAYACMRAARPRAYACMRAARQPSRDHGSHLLPCLPAVQLVQWFAFRMPVCVQCNQFTEALLPVAVEWFRATATPAYLCSAAGVCDSTYLGHAQLDRVSSGCTALR